MDMNQDVAKSRKRSHFDIDEGPELWETTEHFKDEWIDIHVPLGESIK